MYIRIFDDRIEIENPGGLVEGVSKHDFNKSSVRRNPVVADLFHRMGKVERMGSGIDRMRDLMRTAKLKEPIFEMDSFFRVTFYRDPRYSLKKIKSIVSEKMSEKMSEKIISEIRKNPQISAKDVSNILNISARTIERYISKFKKKKVLKRKGPAKGGYWELVKNGKRR